MMQQHQGLVIVSCCEVDWESLLLYYIAGAERLTLLYDVADGWMERVLLSDRRQERGRHDVPVVLPRALPIFHIVACASRAPPLVPPRLGTHPTLCSLCQVGFDDRSGHC